jgi:hypothetical protein
MTRFGKLLGCAIVLTASSGFAQKHPSAPALPTPGTCPAGAICKMGKGTVGSGIPPTRSSNGTPSVSTPAQSKSTLGRILAPTAGKTWPRPGTPDFVNSSNTGSAKW